MLSCQTDEGVAEQLFSLGDMTANFFWVIVSFLTYDMIKGYFSMQKKKTRTNVKDVLETDKLFSVPATAETTTPINIKVKLYVK